MSEENQNRQSERQLVLQKIYVRDASFESPNSPGIFRGEWKPQVKLDLQTRTRDIETDLKEVLLMLTVKVEQEEKTAFLIELQQAGLFTVKGFEGEELGRVLGSYCPNVLYPFAREAVADLVMRGGFPQLLLQPVNFDELYARHVQQQQDGQAASTTH